MKQKDLLISSKKLNKMVSSAENNLFDLEILWFRTVYGDTDIPNTALHSHSFYELHLCLEAQNKYEIAKETITLNEGEFLLLSPHTKHIVHPFEKNYCELVAAFNFKEETQISKYLKDNFAPYYSGDAPDSMISSVQDILKHVFEEKYGYNEYVLNRVSCFFIDLFATVANKMEPDSGARIYLKENDDRIEIIKKYIEDNIDKKILSSDIANQVNISTRHLNRLVKSAENASVAELIRRTRIKYAKKLLMTTQLSLSEIAYETGFSSSFHFNKTFKALEGVTPGVYRKDINK